ncbi:hypothetical protein GCM10017044_01290 [Kordiimonas sediminis]|uniref:Pilus assembly protein CpaD n=1 Tax=Kordiimonas sediminis TaxID=1735581 RepID=A0A919ALA9_9PROT|nr:CpaD family pilus assembly lipoprotein [Kordiimonas sediminis]GHF11290.1 hypothetical protein GCM10017044_01290 [Kordiimonas sediminis]
MQKVQKALRLLVLPVTALTLGACNGQDYGLAKTADNEIRGSVQMVRLPYRIAAEPDGTDTPSHVTYAGLDKFLASIDVGYGDVLLLDSGAGTAPGRADAIASFIKARGLEYGGVQVLGPSPLDGDLILYVERHIYEPPACDNWEAELTDDRRNNPAARHGCANERALGLMVADPRDLVGGKKGETRTDPSVKAVAADRARAAKAGAFSTTKN